MGKKKLPVGILGATGTVGQKFIELLSDHPWFEITAVAASERSQGKRYSEAANWIMDIPIPTQIAEMVVQPCSAPLPCNIVFSGLDSDVAGEIEQHFAQSGYIVISNAKNHRMNSDVPLMIPVINSAHLDLVHMQKFGRGMILTNPNCSVIGLATALKPLIAQWGVEQVHVTTMQAISGAGYPGVASLDILDNVIPFISGEEHKLETEPQKILGTLENSNIIPCPITISAHCNRVPVTNGHTECVSVKLGHQASIDEIIEAWDHYKGDLHGMGLPSAPSKPLIYHRNERYPQPKLHRNLEKGMAVSLGRLRKCPLLDYKFVLLSHNTVLGAAGCALLIAELMAYKGLFHE